MKDGRQVKIVERAKYLGVQLGGQTEMNNREIWERIDKANDAMIRLAKIWKLSCITLEEKLGSIRLWSLV